MLEIPSDYVYEQKCNLIYEFSNSLVIGMLVKLDGSLFVTWEATGCINFL